MKAGWKYVKLGEIATSMYRGTGITRAQVKPSGIPCVRYGEIYTTYQYAFKECVSHTNELEISPRKYFEHGDLLFAITGESVEDIGKTIAYLGTDKCLAGGDIVVMKHNQNAKYLSYALSTPAAIKQKGAGKTKLKVVHTNVPALQSITIPLPSLLEQGEIVAYLDKEFALIDALREKATQQLQATKDLFQTQLKQLLTPKQGWEESTIVNLAENLDSKRIPITSTKRVAGVYPYYGASGVVDYVNSYIFDEDLLLISEDGANLLMRTTPIAFSVSGKIWVNNHAHVFRFANKSTQKFVEYFFASKDISEYITGAAQPKLPQKLLNRIPISVPSLSEQEEIVRKLDTLSEQCHQLEENYRQTISLCNDLKQAVLRQVFE